MFALLMVYSLGTLVGDSMIFVQFYTYSGRMRELHFHGAVVY